MTSVNGKYPTPYEDVNHAVSEVLDGARNVLGDQFVGMYLYGSLALGDFDPETSDIDFIVVSSDNLPEETIESLKKMHKVLWERKMLWADKLEGCYVPKHVLYEHEDRGSLCLMLNEEQFFFASLEVDWILNRHILYEQGVVVAGPSPDTMIKLVTSDQLKEVILEEFRTRWRPFTEDSQLFSRQHYQPFVVLTMCRAIYTFINGVIATKKVSAKWALINLDTEWSELITRALEWRYGIPPGDVSRTQEFMRYVMREAGIMI